MSEHDKFPAPKRLTAASAIWVATAMLHKENPTRPSFTIPEIRQKVHDQGLSTHAESTIMTHIMAHCVANAPLNQGTPHRKLFRVDEALYRLYHDGDLCDEDRLNGKTNPQLETLPPEYRELVTWYTKEYSTGA